MNPDQLKTPDLSFAAALLSFGHFLIGVEPSEGRQKTFVFDINRASHPPGDLSILFHGGQLQVDALTYFNHLRTLKKKLHE
jgi:hypothetical protein